MVLWREELGMIMCVSGWGKGEKGLFVGGCVCREKVVVYGEKGMSK